MFLRCCYRFHKILYRTCHFKGVFSRMQTLALWIRILQFFAFCRPINNLSKTTKPVTDFLQPTIILIATKLVRLVKYRIALKIVAINMKSSWLTLECLINGLVFVVLAKISEYRFNRGTLWILVLLQVVGLRPTRQIAQNKPQRSTLLEPILWLLRNHSLVSLIAREIIIGPTVCILSQHFNSSEVGDCLFCNNWEIHLHRYYQIRFIKNYGKY